MATPVKSAAAMRKHLTEAEKQARAEAEAAVMPDRGEAVRLVPPPLMRGNAAAKKYWTQVTERMAGYAILDDLDSDTLGIYCVMLSRYDALCKDLQALRRKLANLAPETAVDALAELDSVSGKMQRLESNVLQYAEKLGLTPSGRARLARKRAEQSAQDDPDADLFGD